MFMYASTLFIIPLIVFLMMYDIDRFVSAADCGGRRGKCIVLAVILGVILWFPTAVMAASESVVCRDENSLSVFEDVALDDDSLLKIKPIWETELTNDDANEDAHLIFVQNGIIYVFVDRFGKEYDNLLHFRRFYASTGFPVEDAEGEGLIAVSLPDNLTNVQTEGFRHWLKLFVDASGQLCGASFTYKNGKLDIAILSIDVEESISAHELSFQNTEKVVSKGSFFISDKQGTYNPFINEISNVTGSFESGDVSFDFLVFLNNTYKENNFHKLWHFDMADGSLQSSYFGNMGFEYAWEGVARYCVDLGDDAIVYNSSKNGLYKVERLMQAEDGLSVSDCRITEHITDGSDVDAVCNFCFDPVTIGGKTMYLCTNSWTADAVDFRLVRWDDKSSLKNMEPVAVIPENKFRCPAEGRFYKDNMRQFAICQSVGSAAVAASDDNVVNFSKTHLYAYSPGSGLGLYEMALENKDDFGGSTDVERVGSQWGGLIVQGNRIIVSGAPSDVTVYSLIGRVVWHKEAVSCIEMSDFPTGVYIARCGSQNVKFARI